jgi:hypothetical protein
LIEKSRIIKKTEAESINTSRRKQRGLPISQSIPSPDLNIVVDLQAFRKTLSTLQAHVDDLDRLKAQHYQDILEHEAQVWNTVMDKVCTQDECSLPPVYMLFRPQCLFARHSTYLKDSVPSRELQILRYLHYI